MNKEDTNLVLILCMMKKESYIFVGGLDAGLAVVKLRFEAEDRIMKIELCHWEINGYSDSDWHTAIFDTETQTFSAPLVGSTRFGGGFQRAGEKVAPNHPGILQAYKALEEFILNALYDVNKVVHNSPEPDHLYEGLVLEVNVACKFQAKEHEPCKKCNGTGKWINPKNHTDIRDCFTCSGKGYHEKKKEKIEWVYVPVGTHVVVKNWRSFGKFYSNGYNHPDRSNTTVYGVDKDGNHIQVGLKNCKLVGEVPEKESFREKAHKLACDGQFQSATGTRCAWLTEHYAPCPEEFK